MTPVTAEQLEKCKRQAERVRALAGYHRMENGYFSFLGQSLSDSAAAIDALVAEVERLREAIERECNTITELQTGRRDTVLRLRAILASAALQEEPADGT